MSIFGIKLFQVKYSFKSINNFKFLKYVFIKLEQLIMAQFYFETKYIQLGKKRIQQNAIYGAKLP